MIKVKRNNKNVVKNIFYKMIFMAILFIILNPIINNIVDIVMKSIKLNYGAYAVYKHYN